MHKSAFAKGFAMRTTLDIDDTLLMQAKSFAASEHTSLTRLIEESLSLRLRAGQMATSTAVRRSLPIYAGHGGLQASIRNTPSQRACLTQQMKWTAAGDARCKCSCGRFPARSPTP